MFKSYLNKHTTLYYISEVPYKTIYIKYKNWIELLEK